MTRFLLALAAAGLLWGCDALTHEPSGTNPVEVDPTPARLEVDLRSTPDSVVVWDDVRFSYAVSTEPGRAVSSIEILFDDRVMAQTDNRTRAEVSTSDVPDGTYTLRLVTTAPTGTGSLADTLGAETRTVEDTRVVIVDNAPVEASAVSYGEVDGQLEVRWEPRPRPSFQGYRLYRIDGPGPRRLVFQTDDPAETSWADPTFFSGRAEYAVDVFARDQMAAGTPTAQTFAPPTLVAESRIAPDRLRLHWTPAAFSATFDSYRILQAGPGLATTIVAEIGSVSDTTAVVDIPNDVFGASVTYELRTRTRPSGLFTDGGRTAAISRDPLAPIDKVFGAVGGALIGAVRGDVVRVSPTDFARLATFDVRGELREVVVGRNGHVGVFSGQGSFPIERAVHLLDGTSLGVQGQFIQQDVYGSRLSLSVFDQRAVLTDDGRLLASYSEYWSPATYAYLGVLAVDLATGAIQNRLDAEGTRPPSFNVRYDPIRLLGAGPGGRHAVLDIRGAATALYEVAPDGTFQRRGNVGPDTGLAFVSETLLAQLSAGRIHLVDVPSLTERSSFPVAIDVFTGYDEPTGLLVGSVRSAAGPRKRVIGYDPATGDVAFDVEAVDGTQYVAGLLWADGRYRRVAPLR